MDRSILSKSPTHSLRYLNLETSATKLVRLTGWGMGKDVTILNLLGTNQNMPTRETIDKNGLCLLTINFLASLSRAVFRARWF